MAKRIHNITHLVGEQEVKRFCENVWDREKFTSKTISVMVHGDRFPVKAEYKANYKGKERAEDPSVVIDILYTFESLEGFSPIPFHFGAHFMETAYLIFVCIDEEHSLDDVTDIFFEMVLTAKCS